MTQENDFLEKILVNSPSLATQRLILRRFMDEGLHAKVIQHAQNALKANPGDIELMTMLADAYEKTGFLGQAEDMLATICGQLDSLADVFKRLAQIYARQGHTDEALTTLKKYLAHRPEDDEALELLRQWKETSEFVGPEQDSSEKALPAEEEQEEQGITPPTEAPSLQDLATPTLAEIYFNQGQIRDAIQIYESVLARHPDDYEAARRLDELKSMMEAEKQPEVLPQEMSAANDLTIRKEKIISALTSWLGKMQEMNRAH